MSTEQSPDPPKRSAKSSKDGRKPYAKPRFRTETLPGRVGLSCGKTFGDPSIPCSDEPTNS